METYTPDHGDQEGLLKNDKFEKAKAFTDKHASTWHITISFIRKTFCIFYGSALVVALTLYGLEQEKIMTIPYGPGNNHFFQFFKVRSADEATGDYAIFKDSIFLVMFTRLIGAVVAFALILVRGERFKNQAPLWKFLLISIVASLASILQFESLKYVAFTVQILGKCCKTLPVLLWGRCMKGKRYVLMDWISVWLIVLGAILYISAGSVNSPYSRSRSAGWGIVILVLFVMFDGFVSFQQEKLYKQHETSKYNQMLWVNFTSAFWCLLFSLISGHFHRAINFAREYPVLWTDMSFLGGTAIAGQWFIHSIVQDFGANIFLAFLNIRMAASVLCSKWMFSHPTSVVQKVALGVILFALLLRSLVTWTSWSAEESEWGENDPLIKKGEKADEDGDEKREKRIEWAQQMIHPVKNVQRFTQQCAGCCLPISRV